MASMNEIFGSDSENGNFISSAFFYLIYFMLGFVNFKRVKRVRTAINENKKRKRKKRDNPIKTQRARNTANRKKIKRTMMMSKRKRLQIKKTRMTMVKCSN